MTVEEAVVETQALAPLQAHPKKKNLGVVATVTRLLDVYYVAV